MSNRLDLTIKRKEILLVAALWLFSMLLGSAIILLTDSPYRAGGGLIPPIVFGLYFLVRYFSRKRKGREGT